MLVLASLLCFDRAFPPPIPEITGDGATVVLARDGTPLRAFANSKGVWRYPVTPDDVSPLYLEALLGYEDRWFHRHPGVNPLALARASVQALVHGEIVSGGSTLTMQVARLIEPGERSALGKLRQMIRAVQLEMRLTKREILTLYLNLAPFGGSIEGVQAASFAYLGKPAARLSRAEAALLAVLPQAPSRLRPDRHPDAARAARDKVLGRLRDLGTWDAQALAEAQLEPVTARRLVAPLTAALLAERLHAERPDAHVIQTSIDRALQLGLERRVASHLAPLPEKTSAALLVVDNETREVLAYVGSAKFGDADRLGHVDMVRAQRSPGSTLKPFLYAIALDDGLIHSESLLVDAPRGFDGYRPANFGDRFNGPVAASDALRLSLNVPAVDLLARVAPRRFAAKLRHVGLPLALPRGAEPNLAMILGGTGASLEDIVAAYGVFANEGKTAPLRYTAFVGGGLPPTNSAPATPGRALDSGYVGAGAVGPKGPPTKADDRRLVSAGAAWITRTILEAHPRPGDAVVGLDTSSRRRLAWKTGTSYGFRDAWAIGVTPRYTIGVWVGRPDGTPLPGHYGAATAAPLLFQVVDALPRTREDFEPAAPPASVAKVEICWPQGIRRDAVPAALCHRTREALVLDGVVPPTLPDLEQRDAAGYALTWLRDASGLRVAPECATAGVAPRTIAVWPTLAQPWLAARERLDGALPAWSPACREAAVAPAQGLRISGITPGTTLRTAPGAASAPIVDLHALGAEGDVEWLVNGRLVGRSRAQEPLRWIAALSGPASIVAMDRTGRYDRVDIKVLR